jgi:protocatechuate 3,4-dioxygenase beta subunit
MNRALVLALALGAAGCVLWLLLVTGEAPRRGPGPAAEEPPGAPAVAPATTELERDDVPEVEEAPPSAPVAAERAPAREALATPLEQELARAHWVEGRLVFPEGTPADEELFVTANGKDFGDGSDHRARVEPGGSFRVAFSEKSRSGWFTLEGKYLYLPEVVRWKRGETAQPVVLEPLLGSRIAGRAILPPDVEAANVGGRVQLYSHRQESWGTNYEQKGSREVTAELAFSFEALPVGARYDVGYDGETLVGSIGSLSLRPGESRSIELELRPGITLSGVVRDESGAPRGGVDINATSQRESGFWGADRHRSGKSRDDGSFRLGALSPGRIELATSCEGFEPVRLELGELEEGTARAGLELVLKSGLAIEGLVRWPDGSPAEATIDLEPHRSMLEWNRDLQSVQGKSSADGRFRISGLAEASYRVKAQATKTEEVTVTSELTGKERKKKQRSQWKAEIESVAAGTGDLVLTLSTGLAVEGRVVDDLGLALAAFWVRARRVDTAEPWIAWDDPLARSFRDTDGSFRLEGFTPGEWELVASAADHADSAPVRVTVPATAPVQLVVPREALVSGVVLDPAGQPVAGAVVMTAEEEEPNTWDFSEGPSDRTDAQGAFRLRSLPPGANRIEARAPGHATARVTVEAAAGQELAGVVLQLAAGATILGEVLGAGGRPEAGVSVHVSGLDDSVETDAGGRFEARGVEPGDVWLSAETSDGLRLHRNVEVAEGETVRVRLAPPEGGTVRLSGHVRLGGEAKADVNVYASRMREEDEESASSSSSSQTDAEGAYELTLPGPGRYHVGVHGGTVSWNALLDVPATEAFVFDVDVPVGRVSGRVTDASGAPLENVLVRSEPEQHENEAHGSGQALTDAEGRYELALPPGRHAVVAGGDHGWPSSGRAYCEARAGGLVVGENAHLRNVDLVLTSGGTLEGVVRTADGSRTGHVSIWSRSDSGDRHVGWSDEDGAFEIGGLAPGTHWVGASSEGRATAERVRVEIEAGATRRVELVLVRATRVHVLVRDAGGAPLGSELEVTDATGRSFPVQSLEKGEAWAGPLTPGSYTVRARREGQVAEQALELGGGEEQREVVLTFE